MNKKEFKKLCGQIRRSNKYINWKKKILNRDKLNLKSPNVHHIKPFNIILRENNITTLEEAKVCKELWNLENGITIGQGEHRIVSLLERIKYPTKAFLDVLNNYIKENEKCSIK